MYKVTETWQIKADAFTVLDKPYSHTAEDQLKCVAAHMKDF